MNYVILKNIKARDLAAGCLIRLDDIFVKLEFVECSLLGLVKVLYWSKGRSHTALFDGSKVFKEVLQPIKD